MKYREGSRCIGDNMSRDKRKVASSSSELKVAIDTVPFGPFYEMMQRSFMTTQPLSLIGDQVLGDFINNWNVASCELAHEVISETMSVEKLARNHCRRIATLKRTSEEADLGRCLKLEPPSEMHILPKVRLAMRWELEKGQRNNGISALKVR